MKKTTIFLALVAAGFAFTSCEDDKEPVYNIPTEFVLNTPPMAESVYVLSDGDIVELTCSQPNYGYSAVTNYAVDIAPVEDFIEATDEAPANYFTVTPVNSTSARLELKAEDIAKAICESNGITGYAEYPEEGLPVQSAYVRVRAWLTGVASSQITSNTVALGGFEVYNPFPAVPGQIYFVGGPSGWTEPAAGNAKFYEDWKLDETGIGTNVFVGSFDIPEGAQYFRFYRTLGGWGSDGKLPSIGPNAKDGDNKEVSISDEPSEYTAVPGKGAWFTPDDWAGGAVTFTVDLSDANNYKVTMALGEVVKESYVYVVGNPAGWAEPSAANASVYANWALVDRGETGVYRATFTLSAGDVYFRVYPELAGWGSTPYSAAADGSNVDMTLTVPYDYVAGEGCWKFTAAEGEYTFILDTNLGTMAVYEGSNVSESVVYLVGNQADWKEPSAENSDIYANWTLTDRGNSGIYMARYEIPSGKMYFRPYPALEGWGPTPYASPTGENYDLTFGTPANYAEGEGCFVVASEGEELIFKLDTKAGTMMVKQAE